MQAEAREGAAEEGVWWPGVCLSLALEGLLPVLMLQTQRELSA